MFRKLTTTISFLLMGCLSLNVQAESTKFDRMVVFGDSLSDNGNLYSYSFHLVPKSPPYFQGRFSNKKVWSEILASEYFNDKNKFINYAVGGAGAVLSSKEILPYTLWTEMTSFFSGSKSKNMKNTLFFVWIGGNNYLNGPENVDSITQSVVGGIEAGVERLIAGGAKMIMLGNLPDLGNTPQARAYDLESITHELAITHNQKLYVLYRNLQQKYPEVTFGYFDAYSLFVEATSSPQKFGLGNITNECYEGGYFYNVFGLKTESDHISVSDAQLASFMQKQAKAKAKTFSDTTVDGYLANPITREAIQNAYFEDQNRNFRAIKMLKSEPEKDCSHHLFWDKVHPTGFAHQFIAEAMKNAVKAANLEPIE